MSVKNIIVHEVAKRKAGSGILENFRDVENPINDHSQMLIGELTKLFKSTGLSSGHFTMPVNDSDELPHFVNLLNQFYDVENSVFSDFITFTQAASRHFESKLLDSSSNKGGYLWFNHYSHGDDSFLTVVLLRKKDGLSLMSDLSLDVVEQLDLERLHMAVRINLTGWQDDERLKYLVFKVGKTANDVTEYFSKFIGCEEYTAARIDTKNLVKVAKNYSEYHELNERASADLNEFLWEQCTSWMTDGDPVYIDEVSKLLDARVQPQEEGVFLQIAQSDRFLLNNEVTLDKGALGSLKRFSGRGNGINISFEQRLLGETVTYSNGVLTITDLPNGLKAQLESS